MIEINQQIIIANKQIFTFEEYRLFKNPNGEIESEIRFSVKNENGSFIRSVHYLLTGAEHDSFWQSFNTGGNLYELLAQREGLSFTTSPEIEEEFINL
jgi:hypothetical protein